MKDQITVIEEFFDVRSCAYHLRHLFDRRKLWENRQNRKLPYRNGNWYTVGASMYLDLTEDPKAFPAYVQKLNYFNKILATTFDVFRQQFVVNFSKKFCQPGVEIKMLRDVYEFASLPGFHIFPPEETLQCFFGKDHYDHQWKAFERMPHFPFKADELLGNHFSFTLPLALPYQGGGMAIPKGKDNPNGEPDQAFMYEEGNLYVHSGQFRHSVLPYLEPVMPLDWRITYQGHGFLLNNTAYLYW